MERKIGEIFEVGGAWYQCVEGNSCADCAFYKEPCNRNPLDETIGSCRYYRKDATSVIFKKLEKVGEPITERDRTFQCLKTLKTECVGCVFLDSKKSCDKNHYIDSPCPNDEIWVEIKQNKEDMEKYKMYDAKEDIPEFDKVVDECLFGEDKLNLKPFDLQKAREGIIKEWHAPACKNYYYVPGVEVKSVKDVHDTPQESFANLINKVSRRDVWTENPYVFVYDFELVK